MGRRALSEGDKRQPMSARFDPEVRTWLVSEAGKNGHSIPAEIEARVVATRGLDLVGLKLVTRIAEEIGSLGRRNAGKRWHIDLTGWAAVAEMMADGPIQEIRPDDPLQDNVVQAALAPLAGTYDEKILLIAKLARIGVTVALARKIGGLLKINNRELERSSINAIPDPALREECMTLHQQLTALDDAHEAQLKSYLDAMRPYWDAEQAGREIYRAHLENEAKHRRDRGEPFDMKHLLGLFSSWR